MRPSLLLCSAFVLSTGCLRDGALDLSGVEAATYGVAYSADLAVVDYDGPASWALSMGTLPPGLEFTESGVLSGVPEELGTFPIQVTVSNMTGVRDFSGSLDLAVRLSDADLATAFIGWDHDQLNNFHEEVSGIYPNGMMHNVWVRVRGTGVSDQSDHVIDLGVYLPGPDGEAEEGMDDDVWAGDVAEGEVEWEFGTWIPRDGISEYDPGLPHHVPEGDPPALEGHEFQAGADTGYQWATVVHDSYASLDLRLDVTAPDWCSTGVHAGGWRDGCCQIEDCPEDMQ